MLERPSDLDKTLMALADPTRRAILHRLAEGEARVTELARPFAISLNAVSKHIRVLERARFVQRRRAGRDHYLSINPKPLDEASAWIEDQRARWTARLDALDAVLKAEDAAALKRRAEMTADPSKMFRMTRRFMASPERVFDAWIDPETARKWLFTSPTSESTRTELDPRVGGTWTITDRRDGVDYTALGEYLEIDRPRRLVFTFAMPQFDPRSDRIVVEIEPDGAGCILTLTHELLPPEYHAATEDGWSKMFDNLDTVLG
jgi:uncharacterized protein YndB with AHSA1/START domain/DNA-binding transcriptional ArsR family regulator